MRLRLVPFLALFLSLGVATQAVAGEEAPVGRWVVGAPAERKVLNLLADASYQLEFRGADKPILSTGTYAVKDGHLVLTQEKGDPIDFAYAFAKDKLTLAYGDQTLEKGLVFARDAGPIVGKWRSDKLDTTWTLGADGSLESVEAAGTLTGSFEVVYVEPDEVEGNFVIHNADKTTLIFHFALEEKGARLVIGGGPGAKDPAAKFPFERVAGGGTAPAPQPGAGPKRAKFPAAPKLPGGGGAPTAPTPTTPTAPGTPPAEPAPAPAPAPAAEGEPVWDTAVLAAKGLKIIRSSYDADGAKMTWVLEATKDITGFPVVRANFYDVDEIRIWDTQLSFSPSLVSKGERMKGELSLPYKEKLKKVVKIVLVAG